MGECVDSSRSGVNNTSADCITEFENVCGVLGKPYFDSGNDSNDLLLNGDIRFCEDGSNGGDGDRGVHNSSDMDGLNSEGKLDSNGILGGNSENKVVVNLVVITVLFVGRPKWSLH